MNISNLLFFQSTIFILYLKNLYHLHFSQYNYFLKLLNKNDNLTYLVNLKIKYYNVIGLKRKNITLAFQKCKKTLFL